MSGLRHGHDGQRPELDISIVIPAHNEQLLLASTVGSIASALVERVLSYELIVVENGSSDATASIAQKLSTANAAIKVLSLSESDYGEALFTGITAARAPIVATFDVDLYDTGFLDLALRELDTGAADVVIASKRAKGAKDRRPPIRRILTFGFAMLLQMLVDLRVSDAHGMKVFRRDAIARIAQECAMRGSLFDVEMIVRATKRELRLVEIPVSVRELRPPRTGIVKRSVESLNGALQLRRILRSENAG